MTPVSFRVLVRNAEADPLPGAERAAILLGEKVLGEASWMPDKDLGGVRLIGVQFHAPGFRRRTTDAPLGDQQDALVRTVFPGATVQRSDKFGVSILASDGSLIERGSTWDAVFTASLPRSRIVPDLLQAVAEAYGGVSALALSLSSEGKDVLRSAGFMEAPGGLLRLSGSKAATSSSEAPQRPSAAPREPRRGERVKAAHSVQRTSESCFQFLTEEELHLYLTLLSLGDKALAHELLNEAIADRVSLFEAEERDVYEQLLVQGNLKVANELLRAVIDERMGRAK